jgi:ABC-type glycerol-3-phosphate transport system permease component
MTARLRQPILRRPTFGFYAKIILLVLLAFWMVPEIYMVSVSLRPPDKSFDPSLFVRQSLSITLPRLSTTTRFSNSSGTA